MRLHHIAVQSVSNSLTSYVPSEGAAGLILKTKSAAIRDGDNILAIIRSTDVKHDGRSQGLVAPNVKAQIAMQIALLEKANLAPAEIEYVAFYFYKQNYCLPAFSFIEAHGTGTHLIHFIVAITDTRIKVPPLGISLRLRGSTKFSNRLMDLRIPSLLALLSLVLVMLKPYQA